MIINMILVAGPEGDSSAPEDVGVGAADFSAALPSPLDKAFVT